MHRQKKTFTLLEVLIAIGLTLLIVSMLMGAYLNLERSSAWWQVEEKTHFQERFVAHRLMDVFSHLFDLDQTKTFFFTSDSSLIFSYDNGASLDPSFSGPVLGRIFIDPQGDLYLMTWPERELWSDSGTPPFHREVLMKNVASLQFSFLNKDENGTSWKTGFSKENKALPAAIRLALFTKDQRAHTFYFPIPQILPYFEEKP